MDIKNPTAPCICCYTLPCETLMSSKQALNDKLQGSVATYLICGEVVNNQIRKAYCWVCERKFKIGEYLVRLQQERDCFVHFLRFYRAMLCIRSTSHGPVSVCHKSEFYYKSKRRITQTTPHDSPETLVFWCQRSTRNSTGITPYEGAECRWGGQNRRLSTNNRLYLENGTR